MSPSLTLLLFAASAGPVVTPTTSPGPAVEVRAAPDALVALDGAAGSTWLLATEQPCRFWPDGAVCRVSASIPGRYLVLAVSGADVKRFVVVVDPPQPMPPGPAPVPPVPVPPVDPLAAKLAAAFALDKSVKADVLKLAALYRAACPLCRSATIKTAEQLLAAIRAAGPTMPDPLASTALPNTRKAFSAELSAVIGTDLKAPLTDAGRDKLADLFSRAESILEGLGK